MQQLDLFDYVEAQKLWEQYVANRYLWNKQQGYIRYWPTQKEAQEDQLMYKKIFENYKEKA